MVEYYINYKKQRAIVEASSKGAARNKASIIFGLTRAQQIAVGVEPVKIGERHNGPTRANPH